MRETTWRTDEPCPTCGAELVLVDDGQVVPRAECRACGYGETFGTTDRADGEW
jgi:ribosomal protein S27AE